jgi:dihydrodipicolinate synthase/N-acetylneuraminate lyase
MKAASFSLAQPETVYFCGSAVSWSINDSFFDGNASLSGVLVQDVSTPQLTAYAGTNIGFTSGLAVGSNGVVSTVFNGVSSALRINRTAAITGNGGAASMNGFTLGARGGISLYSNITTSEIIVYAATQDQNTQNLIITYLGMVWKILLG